jgi:hypothetical protein
MLAASAASYGVLALLQGADRLSATVPAISRMVPGPLRASAAVSAAQTALSRKDAVKAEAEASAAIAHAPLDRFAIGALAVARLSQGKEEDADTAFRVSAQLGWRDVPTQLYWYQVGVSSGDWTLASQRMDAILRAHPTFPQAAALLQPMEDDPEGRKALLDRMEQRPGWLETYAIPPKEANAAELARKTTVLAMLGGRGVALRCKSVNDLAFALVDNGMRNQALGLWSSHCSKAGVSSLVFDPQFQALSSERQSPFDWRTRGSGDVEVRTAQQPDGTMAGEVANNGAFTVPVLSQTVQLQPGAYRVRLEVAPPAGVGDKIFATLSCGPVPVRSGGPAEGLTAEGQVLTTPRCESQVLGIWLKGNSGRQVLRRISVARVN